MDLCVADLKELFSLISASAAGCSELTDLFGISLVS